MRLLKGLALFALTFSVSALTTQPQGIEVIGKAEINAVPDVFVLEMTVVERGISAVKIKHLVDHKSKQVIKAAISIGANEKDIQSAQVNVFPVYEQPSIVVQDIKIKNQFPNDKHGKVSLAVDKESKNNSKFITEVSRTIKITLYDLSQYDRLLDSISKIGVARIYPISMSVSNAGQLYQQALDKAILDAKRKATRIAAQAGVSINKLSYMKEVSYGAPYSVAMMSERGGRFQSSTGQQKISAQIIATYSINP